MTDTLISERVVLDAVTEIEAMVEQHAEIYGEGADQVKLGTWITARLRQGVKKAREHYLGIPEASAASGWNEQTIRKYARMVAAGQVPPAPWNEMEIRGGAGAPYSVLVSTLPPHPRD